MAKRKEMELPEDVLMEILLRLPARSALRFSCVSKQWHSIIGDVRFRDLHSLRSPPSAGHLSPATLFLRFHALKDPTASNQPFITLSYAGSTVQHMIRLQHSAPEYVTGRYMFSMTCDGLLCIFSCYSFDQHSILVCNPLTLQYVALPPCSAVKRLLVGLPGLGLVPSTKEYKVVCISLQDNNGEAHAKGKIWVHTVGDGVWREVEPGVELDSRMAPVAFSSAVYAGGKIYWLFHDYLSEGPTVLTMLSFDVEREKAAIIGNVPGFLEEHCRELEYRLPDYRLVALGDGGVTLFVNKGFGSFGVWGLIEDGRWDLKHKIDEPRLSGELLAGIWELGDGDVLVLLQNMTTMVLHGDGRDAVIEKQQLQVSMSWMLDWSLCCGYKPGFGLLGRYDGCQMMEIISEETNSKYWLNPPPNLLSGCNIHQC